MDAKRKQALASAAKIRAPLVKPKNQVQANSNLSTGGSSTGIANKPGRLGAESHSNSRAGTVLMLKPPSRK